MQAFPTATSEGYFGNITNPFGEIGLDEDKVYFSDPHRVTYHMIEYLAQAYLRDEQIVTRQEGNTIYRSLVLDCSAPYWKPNNLYLDGGAPPHIYDENWRIKPAGQSHLD